MKTRMVSFTDEMVRAMLDGRKDVTRRPITPQPELTTGAGLAWRGGVYGMRINGSPYTDEFVKHCPLGQPGDHILVRERARVIGAIVLNGKCTTVRLRYEADGAESMWTPWPARLRPVPVGKCIPNGVFVEGARLRREIVSVRVERVQDITEEDARREGVADMRLAGCNSARDQFKAVWDQIYRDSWTRNDWVWRVEMREVAS